MKISLFLMFFIISFYLLIPVYSNTDDLPLQQWKDGVSWINTICKDELYLVGKNVVTIVTQLYAKDPEGFNKNRLSTTMPACVQLETAVKLYKRGWAENMEEEVWNVMAKRAAEEFVISNINEKYQIVEGTLNSGFKGQRDSLPPQITIGVMLSVITDNEEKINLSFNVGIKQGDNISSISVFKWDSNWENWENLDASKNQITNEIFRENLLAKMH